MNERIVKLLYLTPVIAGCVLLVLWNTTSPLGAGPLGMLAVFLFLYIFWLGVFFIILRLFALLRTAIMKLIIKRSMVAPIDYSKRNYYLASVFAFIPVFLIAMQSIGQLGVQDVLLIVGFVIVATFYVIKRS